MEGANYFKTKERPSVEIHVDNLRKYFPPCECGSCEQQFIRMDVQHIDCLRYEKVVSPADAKSTISTFVAQINKDRAHLVEICDKFGDIILSRWKKKSRDKREALLLEADPTIEKQAWYRLANDGWDIPWKVTRECHRKIWLLPYMCTTTLKSNPSVLLGLIHNRVHYSPQQWVAFDNDMIRQGWSNGTLGKDHCGQYCVVMQGTDYGRLVSWNKEAAERWDIVGYPRARLIIEAQALMLSRLRSIVDLILEGIPADSIAASDKWQDMARAGSKQSNHIELWSDYINQPFSSPPRFDVDYYCSVAQARMQASQDHLWLLQTDPSYARRFIRVMATGEAYRTDWKYDLIAQDIHQAVAGYMRWQELNEAWSGIRDDYNRFRDSIHQGQPLPQQFELSLALLEVALLMILDKRNRHFHGYIPQRPGFQHLWEVTPWAKGTVLDGKRIFGKITRLCKTPMDQQWFEDPLDWTVMNLQSKADAEYHFDHSELFGRLEAHLAEANPKERARLDETIYAKLSEFAALHEMLSAVRLHRPAFVRRSPQEVVDMINCNSTPFTRGLGTNDAKSYFFRPGTLKSFDQMGAATGRKSEAWLEHRAAERLALNSFWIQARAVLRVELSSTRLKQDEIDAVLAVVSISTTTEYTDLVDAERLQVLDAVKEASLTTYVADKVVHQNAFEIKGPDVSKLTIETRTPKSKTRPCASAAEVAPEAEPTVAESTIEQITATRRAFEMTRKMFPASADDAAAKDTDWDLFVHSMADLNFAARNVGGSAVAFDHAASGRKIIFHRPHPVSKIDSVMLQSMGKRLNKHFGWNRDIFVEA
ncbi:hypothetical protein D6D10_05775 [Aureobasidium pullulans]|uniref:Uncharacterized protein n=1 Tax=Aureobasidium pullulans TaxID=5580 RepID=A0A4S9ES14_AURPU|nr:hypothetical protein D6D10_05775 [Aureobasidium pullulans]